VCCSVLLCVVVCCSMLQCVAVCYSVLQCVAVCYSVLQCVVLCLSLNQVMQGHEDTSDALSLHVIFRKKRPIIGG